MKKQKMKEFEYNREKLANVLETMGAVIFLVLGVVFAGWAAYSLYGYITVHGFEWKQLLYLLSKDGILKVIIRFMGAIQWTGLLFSIGWATLMMGRISRQMNPDQGNTKRAVSLLRFSLMLLSAAMSVVLLIMGKIWLFYVPLIICLVGSFGHSDDDEDDDQKTKELEEKTKEVEQLHQRVEELEKKLAETAVQEQESDNQF